MKSKQQIQNIKNNSERVIEGLVTKQEEFIYDDNLSKVKPNTTYSTYYTLNKKEYHLTGIKSSSYSRVINRVKNKSLFQDYSSLKQTERQDYPREYKFIPTKNDYDIGEVTRYFTQIANDNTKPIYEITKDDFLNKNSLFKYIKFNWKISGTKSEVERDNNILIASLNETFKGISSVLFPLQLWTPPKDSKEDLENKLSRLKK